MVGLYKSSIPHILNKMSRMEIMIDSNKKVRRIANKMILDCKQKSDKFSDYYKHRCKNESHKISS